MNHPSPSLRSSQKYFHLPAFMLLSTNTSITAQHQTGSSITNIIFWLETTHWTYSFPPPCLCGRRKPHTFKGTTCISWILQLHRCHTFSWLSYLQSHAANHADLSLWSHFFFFLAVGYGVSQQEGPREILRGASVPFLAQLHPGQGRTWANPSWTASLLLPCYRAACLTSL